MNHVDDNNRKVTYYLKEVFTPHLLYAIAKRLRREIMRSGIKFDLIVGSGFGGLVIPVLAIDMIKPYAMVRTSDQTHSEYIVEGIGDSDDYIIVDDSIWRGSTIKRIIEKVGRDPKGVFLYNDILEHQGMFSFPVYAFYFGNRDDA